MVKKPTKIGIVLVLMILGNTIIIGADDEEYHFRHTRWGMTSEEVKRVENGEPHQKFKEKSLVYKSELLGENVLVVYTFAFNKLIRAKYMLLKYFTPNQQKIFNPSALPKKPFVGECIADFDKFEKALIEKYGKPEAQQVQFSKEIDIDNEKRSDNEDLEVMENAIRNAKGYWSSKWKTKDTGILLFLHGGKGDLVFEISYSSIRLSHFEKDVPL